MKAYILENREIIAVVTFVYRKAAFRVVNEPQMKNLMKGRPYTRNK